ncbi:hypothetical protein EN741_30585 [Mesorhizobium sp. M4B.F.Ca.ET.019.03.1.1]|nr:hypothetical protein EN741_30585 [Mesorhizobium sp. M4B.F.Ca.ET.019.03.1.1]
MEYMKKAMNKSEKEVKDKKACHATCPKAKDQARLVQVAKKRLKKAAGGESVVVTAADVAPSKVSC